MLVVESSVRTGTRVPGISKRVLRQELMWEEKCIDRALFKAMIN